MTAASSVAAVVESTYNCQASTKSRCFSNASSIVEYVLSRCAEHDSVLRCLYFCEFERSLGILASFGVCKVPVVPDPPPPPFPSLPSFEQLLGVDDYAWYRQACFPLPHPVPIEGALSGRATAMRGGVRPVRRRIRHWRFLPDSTRGLGKMAAA